MDVYRLIVENRLFMLIPIAHVKTKSAAFCDRFLKNISVFFLKGVRDVVFEGLDEFRSVTNITRFFKTLH